MYNFATVFCAINTVARLPITLGTEVFPKDLNAINPCVKCELKQNHKMQTGAEWGTADKYKIIAAHFRANDHYKHFSWRKTTRLTTIETLLATYKRFKKYNPLPII
jgi:hypothetical protein